MTYSLGMLRCWLILVFGLVSIGCTEAKKTSVVPTVVEASGGSEGSGVEAWPDKLVLAITPYFGKETSEQELSRLAGYLSDEVGVPVTLSATDSYEAMLDVVATGKFDIAVLSPLHYVRAKVKQPNLSVLALEILDGAPVYMGYIVALAGKGIDSVQDLRGKRFAFVDPSSTSGYLYALSYLRQNGVTDPDRFFDSVVFAGDHDRLLAMLRAGEVDAGATCSSALKLARREPKLGNQPLKILAKTGEIPNDSVVANPRLPAALVDRVRTALLTISTRGEQGRSVLGGPTRLNGFVARDDSVYDDVRRVLSTVEGKPAPENR